MMLNILTEIYFEIASIFFFTYAQYVRRRKIYEDETKFERLRIIETVAIVA